MKKMMIAVSLILASVILIGAGLPWTEKQTAAHEAAEILRAAGVDEASEPIQALKGLWWDEEAAKQEQETPAVVFMAATTPWDIYAENHPGYRCGESGYYTLGKMCFAELGDVEIVSDSWDENPYYCQACVALNRVESGACPDDVIGVITQRNQFNPNYVTYTQPNIPQKIWDAIDQALTDTVREVPSNVWYAAQGAMGSGIYKQFSGVTVGGYQWQHVYSYR